MSSPLTVVTPTYNEAENLPKLVSALRSLPILDLRILIVDDNSPDGTGQIADELADADPEQISVLHRPGKLGLGTAYIQGFRRALDEGAGSIVQMDTDFSHPPEKVVELCRALQDYDFVLGSRYIPGGRLDERWPFWRKALSNFGNFYARAILRLPMRDITGGFRGWRRETLLSMPFEQVKSNGYAFQVEMIYLAHKLGYRGIEIPIYFADRRWGQSKMSLGIQREAASRVWQMLFEYRNLARKK